MAQAEDAVWLPVLPSMKGFGSALIKGAGSEADKSGKEVGKKFGKAIVIGTAAIGAAVGATGVALYKVGEVFDDVVDTIRTGTGATGDNLDGLVDVAKRVGSKVPAEFEAIGSTVADVNTRMGLSGETLEKVASQYLEAGRILGEEVDIMKTGAAFNAFGIEGEKVSGALDHLFQVSQATGIGMNELADGVARNAPAIQSLGFSFEESAVMIGQFDKAGLNSGAIMASMSKGLVTLAKDGENPQKAFRRVVGEIDGFIKKGDEAGALKLASKVFGTKGATQFMGALKSGTMNLEDMTKAAGQTGDTILGVGEETMDFAEQWQLFKNRVLVWLEPVASKVFGAMGTAMELVNTYVEAFGSAWDKNDGVVSASGILGIMELLGGVAHQTFDYFTSTVIPNLVSFGLWLGENAGTIGMVAGLITALFLPVLVRLGVEALISGAKQVAGWAMAGGGAVKTAALYVVNSYKMIGAWVAMGLAALKSGAETAYVWLLYRLDSLKAVAAMIGAKVKIAAQWLAMSAAAVASGIKTGAVWTVQVIGKAVAGAIAFGIQAARVVAGWVLMGVQAGLHALKMAAGWTVGVLLPAVAGAIAMGVQAALVVGGWVLMSVQSLLHAGRMAASWLIAMGPIGWVIGAVIGLVALIVANWDTVSAWTKKAWEATVGWVVGAWQKITAFTTTTWAKITAIFTGVTKFLRDVFGAAFRWLQDSVIKPVFLGIQLYIQFWWAAVKLIFTTVTGFIRGTFAGAFTWLRDSVITPVWNAIKNTISSVYEKGIKPVFTALVNLVKTTIPDAFRKGRDAVDSIWRKVANIARKPVNFVIGTIYNAGLKSMFNGIASKLGLPWKLPDVANLPAFAKGGEMRKGWKLVGEEGPELINTGPGFVYTASQTKQMLAGKTQAPEDSLGALSGDSPRNAKLANGGFWGDVLGGIKSGAGMVKDWAVGQIGEAVKALVKPIKSGMSAAMPGPGMNELIRGAGFKLIDDMTGWAVKKDAAAAPTDGSFAGSYDGPLGRFHRPSRGPFTSMFGPRWGSFHAGVDIAGGGKTFAALNGIVKYIGKGGGLPGRTGHGIRLAHGGGFETYYGHNPYNGVKVRLGQNVKAGQHIGYQGATGNVTGTHLHFETLRNGRPQNPMSYLHDNGGVLNTGLSMIWNKTKKPEAIYNHVQNRALQTLAARGAGVSAPGGLRGDVRLVLEDGTEFRAYVEKTADARMSKHVTDLRQPSRQLAGTK